MEFKVWILYLLTEFLMAITPGPAVILISSQGFKYGAKSSIFGSLGISGGNLMYFILSACGIGTLILTTGNLFQYIKICGAIYLICTGIIMFYKSFKASSDVKIETKDKQNNIKSFVQGFITESANPKAIMFFVALIPMFIDESRNIVSQFAVMGLTTIIVETLILIFYGWISANGKKKFLRYSGFNNWKDKIAGLTLIGLGVNLIFTKTK